MYTFQPLATIPVDHTGFAIVCAICVIFCVMVLLNDSYQSFFQSFFVCTCICALGYCFSYIWTDQTPKTFSNDKVVGEFAGYAPEGYRERSGKTMVDKHYIYVIYKVNGNPVLLQAKEGYEYPQRAVLYKN